MLWRYIVMVIVMRNIRSKMDFTYLEMLSRRLAANMPMIKIMDM